MQSARVGVDQDAPVFAGNLGQGVVVETGRRGCYTSSLMSRSRCIPLIELVALGACT
jgi:hypothetical protein